MSCCASFVVADESASPIGRRKGSLVQLFKVIGAHVPPPAGLKSPAFWGTQPYMVELFGSQAASIRTERRVFNFRYLSAAHWLQVFQTTMARRTRHSRHSMRKGKRISPPTYPRCSND